MNTLINLSPSMSKVHNPSWIWVSRDEAKCILRRGVRLFQIKCLGSGGFFFLAMLNSLIPGHSPIHPWLGHYYVILFFELGGGAYSAVLCTHGSLLGDLGGPSEVVGIESGSPAHTQK